MKKMVMIIVSLFMVLVVENTKCNEEEWMFRKSLVETIFWDITKSFDKPYPNNLAPNLVFSDDKNKKIAFWQYPNIVFIENRFISLCFDKYKERAVDAIAAILGHELTHYFEQHDVSDFGFIDRNNDEIKLIMSFIDSKDASLNESEKSIGKRTIRRIMEAQADRRGLFYGYVAGYQTLVIYDELLDDIYDWYSLSDTKLEFAYYPKEDRKKIAIEQINVLKELLPFFDSSIILLASKSFEKAALSFDYLIDEFPSREILNNAGLSYLLAAYHLLEPKDVLNFNGIRLELPFSLSSSSRLSDSDLFERSSRGLIDDNKLKAFAFIDSAKNRFNKAILLDDNYFLSYINLSLLFLIEGKTNDADNIYNYLIKNEKYADTEHTLEMIKALIDFQNGYYKQSKKKFLHLKNDSYIAERNYNILSNKQKEIGLFDFIDKKFEIGGVKISDISNLRFEKSVARTSNLSPIEVSTYNYDGSWLSIRVVLFNNDVDVDYFLIARSNYSGSLTDKVMIGSKNEDVIKDFGEPDYSLILSSNVLYVYNRFGLMIQLNKDRYVNGFIIF